MQEKLEKRYQENDLFPKNVLGWALLYLQDISYSVITLLTCPEIFLTTSDTILMVYKYATN